MLAPHELKNLLLIVKLARTVKTPIQWKFIGDFLSLPPQITKKYQNKSKDDTDFGFQLHEWDLVIHKTIYLTKNKRQISDNLDPTTLNAKKMFVEILDDIRSGALLQLQWAAKFNACVDKLFDRHLPVTHFYSKPELVAAENESQLKKLKTTEYKFYAQKGYQIGNKVYPLHVPKSRQNLYQGDLKFLEKMSINEIQRGELLKFLDKHAVVEPMIVLKRGAFVVLMATLNRKMGLIKGAQGGVDQIIYLHMR